MDTKKIGQFLKFLRRENGFTQEELAEKLNVSSRTVSRWETGVNMPDLSILMEIAELYQVEIMEILDREKEGMQMDKTNEKTKNTLAMIADYGENWKFGIWNNVRMLCSCDHYTDGCVQRSVAGSRRNGNVNFGRNLIYPPDDI